MTKRVGEIFHFGPWQVPYKAHAMCSDGRMRMVKLSSEPDTFFSIPARLSYRNTTVTGYVTWSNDTEDDIQTLQFRPYLYCKNHELLPPWQ